MKVKLIIILTILALITGCIKNGINGNSSISDTGKENIIENQKETVNNDNLKKKEPSHEKLERTLNNLDIKKFVMSDSMTISGEYAYYRGEEGVIYIAPLENLNNARALYQLPTGCVNPREDGYPHVDFTSGKNSAIMTYIVNGASSPVSVVLFPDWNYKELSGDFTMACFYIDNAAVVYTSPVTAGPAPINLIFFDKTEKDYRILRSIPPYFRESIELAGNDIYYLDHEKIEDPLQIHKINIYTKKLEKVIDEPVEEFKISGETIYFRKPSGGLYKANLDKKTTSEISDKIKGDFFILGSNIYYTDSSGKGLYKLYEDKNLIPQNYHILSQSISEDYMTMKASNFDGPIIGIVIDNEGNIFYTDPNDDIVDITVYNEIIYQFYSN